MADNDLLQSTLKFNNVVPIVTSAIMMTASVLLLYSAINVRLSLSEQSQVEMGKKLDILIAQNDKILEKTQTDAKEWETRYGSLALKIGQLETLEGLRK